MSSYLEFWRDHALENIKPEIGKEYPEGELALNELRDVVGEDEVMEVGCGYGRLAFLFKPENYRGIDVCPAAIEIAKTEHGNYRFDVVRGDEVLPHTAAKFCYTVLLHVPDYDLEGFVSRLVMTSDRVIIAEILGREWRRNGNPPVFNRELAEYEDQFGKYGMTTCQTTVARYVRYITTEITFMEFTA